MQTTEEAWTQVWLLTALPADTAQYAAVRTMPPQLVELSGYRKRTETQTDTHHADTAKAQKNTVITALESRKDSITTERGAAKAPSACTIAWSIVIMFAGIAAGAVIIVLMRRKL